MRGEARHDLFSSVALQLLEVAQQGGRPAKESAAVADHAVENHVQDTSDSAATHQDQEAATA